MSKILPVSILAMIKPFAPAYYVFCVAVIFLFSYIDSPQLSADDATYTLCEMLESGDDSRALSVPVTLLLMLPLFLKLFFSLRRKEYVWPVFTVLLFLYWWWSFFGIYLSC
ncbi:DUF2645 family protein [Buttiauxella gaviniae]|uniref:DUF2645 family protein n=1 Tax=Buttiauxella gaviniae TaxID=82990 RepID=A0ABV3NP39_9ENTR